MRAHLLLSIGALLASLVDCFPQVLGDPTQTVDDGGDTITLITEPGGIAITVTIVVIVLSLFPVKISPCYSETKGELVSSQRVDMLY